DLGNARGYIFHQVKIAGVGHYFHQIDDLHRRVGGQRFFESGRCLGPTVADTGRAIMLCTLTSVCGFGSLAVGGFPGITSMGMLCNLALAANLVASLVVFPALLAIFFPSSEEGDRP
ncbi:MAG: MMPL family transporter, partial [Planctomycetota bacterium]|nr:MMPL family transporter [Planctomycetota bacterium]